MKRVIVGVLTLVMLSTSFLTFKIPGVEASTRTFSTTSHETFSFTYPSVIGNPGQVEGRPYPLDPDPGVHPFTLSFYKPGREQRTLNILVWREGLGCLGCGWALGPGPLGTKVVDRYTINTAAQGYPVQMILLEGKTVDGIRYEEVMAHMSIPNYQIVNATLYSIDNDIPNIVEIMEGIVRSLKIRDEQYVNPVRNQTYRFYNTENGAHIYTSSEVEKNSIMRNLPHINYEGLAYLSFGNGNFNASQVYRFFNTHTGSHFYTSSGTEANSIMRELPHYKYEGIGFYVYRAQEQGTIPMYRFYNNQTGAHFYTISEGEKNEVIRNLPHYSFEGVAFYVAG